MDKQEKTAIAVSNTQRFKIGRPDYKAVDGRTYQLDRKTPSGKAGGADKILDYASPRFCLYSSGLRPPRDSLIRFSRYQTI